MARISGVTIPANKQVWVALTYVFGIGPKSANDIITRANVEPTGRVKDLTDAEIGRIQEVINADYLVEGELQRLVNSLALKQLLTLAATNTAPESVRGIALLEIDGLKKWMHSMVSTSAGNQRANLLFGLSQIEEFEKNPDKFKPAAALNMPDGSPIGSDE